METRTVQVKRVSDLATEREVHEFFSFSGEIEHIEIRQEPEQPKTAFVTFKDPKALEIALLLSGATIVDQVVSITPAEDYVVRPEIRVILLYTILTVSFIAHSCVLTSQEFLTEASEVLENVEEVENPSNCTLPNAYESENSLASMQYKDEAHKIGGSNAEVATMSLSHSVEVTVQALKKPSRAFGAMLGSSAKRKFDPDKREQEETKLEHIKSTVSLPFHTFLGRDDQLQSDDKEPAKKLEVSPRGDISATATGSTLEDIIVLDDDSDADESAKDESGAASNNQLNQQENNEDEMDEGDEPMSLSDLSSSFQKCLTPDDHTKSSKGADKSQASGGFLQVEPFDYEAARKQVKFGKGSERETTEGSGGKNRSRPNKEIRKKSTISESEKGEGTAELLPQGRRRQAFPVSGNRSATFR